MGPSLRNGYFVGYLWGKCGFSAGSLWSLYWVRAVSVATFPLFGSSFQARAAAWAVASAADPRGP